MKKRILYINTALNTGSTGHIVEQLAAQAVAAGDECLVVHGARYCAHSSVPEWQIAGKWNEYLHALLSLLNLHGLGSCIAALRLIRKIRTWKPDLIHIHNIHGYYVNFPLFMRFLRGCGVPVIWTLHDCWLLTGRCASFAVSGCGQWKTGCSVCPGLDDYPRSLVRYGVSRNYMLKKRLLTQIPNLTFVSVSQWLDGIVAQSFLSGCRHLAVVNGIDTAVFKPVSGSLRRQMGLEGKFVVVGVAGVWCAEKGLFDWKALAERLDSRFAIVMVGNVPDDVLPPSVLTVGTAAPAQLAEIYSMADVVLSLSRQETFGMTLAEAMACGTPVMAYSNTAMTMMCSEKVGWLVNDRDLDAVAGKIESLYGSSEVGEKAAACRDYVLEHYNLKNNLMQYMKLYTDTITRK